MIRSLARTVRERRQRLLERPFWRLVAHFGSRLFAGGSDSGEGELGLGVGTILALLAAPGGFISILLLDKYSSLLRWARGHLAWDPYAASLSDQYFFLTFSMVITGIVTVLKWESIFPDRCDYMNLAPLPIPTRNIFLANITAIVAVAVIFAVDVNAASSILFPVFVTMELPGFNYYVQFAAGHFAGVLLAGLFIFFAMFAVIGALMLALPQNIFRRVSLYVRVAIVTVLLLMLFSGVLVPQPSHTAMGSRLLDFLPPVWFLGLSRLLMGKATPELARLGALGIRVTLVTVAAAALAYVLNYHRYFIRIPEMLETTLPRRGRRGLVPARLLDRFLLRSPFERACYRFAMKTLLRNERHSLIFGAFAGLGLVVAAKFLVSSFGAAPSLLPNSDFLSIPLALSFFIIGGLRFVFEIPAELRANWVHRSIVDLENHQATAVAQNVMLTFVWPWVLLVSLPLYAWKWGWPFALAHTYLVLAWSYCLGCLLLRRFRKIPFTCAYSPWRQHATVMPVLYLLGFIAYASITADIEHDLLLRSPWAVVIFATVCMAGWKFLLYKLQDEYDETTLTFDEVEAQPFEMLNLSRS